MICPACLAELAKALQTEAEALLEQADKAAGTPRLRVHADTLRRQSAGLCYAIGWLRDYTRKQWVGV